eukprot:scaffold21616_cov52-Attheya_sp.AAC.1
MVTKWDVDMVTRGGELLIASVGARRRKAEDEKASKKGGGLVVHPIVRIIGLVYSSHYFRYCALRK